MLPLESGTAHGDAVANGMLSDSRLLIRALRSAFLPSARHGFDTRYVEKPDLLGLEGDMPLLSASLPGCYRRWIRFHSLSSHLLAGSTSGSNT